MCKLAIKSESTPSRAHGPRAPEQRATEPNQGKSNFYSAIKGAKGTKGSTGQSGWWVEDLRVHEGGADLEGVEAADLECLEGWILRVLSDKVTIVTR